MPFPQAALEKRLTVCCFLGAGAPKGSRACSSCLEVYVGAFSAFFNFFQLTEAGRPITFEPSLQVDDVLLDRDSSFTLDFSRPLEPWIAWTFRGLFAFIISLEMSHSCNSCLNSGMRSWI